MTVQERTDDLSGLAGFLRVAAERTGVAPTLVLVLWEAYTASFADRAYSAWARQGFTAWLELSLLRVRMLEAQLAQELG